MIKEFINKVKNIEKKTARLMIKGFNFSFVICIISFFISLTYILNPVSHVLYKSGIILFKTGLTFGVMSFISAFAVDNIKKELNS